MRLPLATSLAVFLLGLSPAWANMVAICEQRVEFSPRFQKEALSPEQAELWGVWSGEVDFGGSARMCIGFLIGRIDEKGEPSAIYAWNSANISGIYNVVTVGTNPWRGGRYINKTLTLTGQKSSFAFTRVADDTLEGVMIANGQRYPAVLKRRSSSP
jgi:hypothetical protein